MSWLLLFGLLVACRSSPVAQAVPSPEPGEDLQEAPLSGEEPSPPPAGIDVLFVGNSYTYSHDLPTVLSQLADSADAALPIRTRMVAEPDWTLQQHWEDRRAVHALQEGGWEYVVLQGHSLSTLESRERWVEYARRLDAVADSEGAQTVLFMTWARRGRPEMLDVIESAYDGLGARVGALVAPVGVAWKRAREEHPGIHLHHADGSHPSPAGSYLAAAVFYELLAGRSSLGADHGAFGFLDTAEVRALQEVAAEVVRRRSDASSDPGGQGEEERKHEPQQLRSRGNPSRDDH